MLNFPSAETVDTNPIYICNEQQHFPSSAKPGATDWTRNDSRDQKLIVIGAAPPLPVRIDLNCTVLFPRVVVGT